MPQLLRGDRQRYVWGYARSGFFDREVAGRIREVRGLKAGGTSAEICWPLRAGIGRLTFFCCISLFIAISHWGRWNRFVWIRWCWDRNLRLERRFSCIFGKRRPFYLGWVLMIWRSCLLLKTKDLGTVKIQYKKHEQICFCKSTDWWQVVKFGH